MIDPRGKDYIVHVTDDLEVVDERELIRCAQCRWCRVWEPFGKKEYQCTKWVIDGSVSLTDAEGYCYRAERKEE